MISYITGLYVVSNGFDDARSLVTQNTGEDSLRVFSDSRELRGDTEQREKLGTAAVAAAFTPPAAPAATSFVFGREREVHR